MIRAVIIQPPHQLARTPIAIVGLACMFPQARNVGEFWSNVVASRDTITDVPATHWRDTEHFHPDPLAEDRTYCRRGGFLPAQVFDPFEFGIPPRSLDAIGLVQLLSLNVARDVLRDAGCTGAEWYDPSRTGVILGVCGPNSSMGPLIARTSAQAAEKAAASCGLEPRDAAEIARRYLAAFTQWTPESFPGLLGNVVAGRIAKHFHLGGASYTVDAACASSLAALRAAVDELVLGRADLMITGGCDADNTIFAFLCFSKTPALSRTGHIRPFDVDADGTMLGEGIGMLALKRLADAERDNDRVYAVIRGIGNSTDGPETSIYAPCGEGQFLALHRAYADADVPAESVGLIEAHGTGTPVGDEVELAALNRLFDGAPPRSVPVGTVKSQIGHTKAAAGAASLIKAALALHHKVLPPTINVEKPSSEASRAAIYVNSQTRPWISNPRKPLRRSGVSSFGFGGVNFHVVLDEYEGAAGTAPRTLHPVPRACLWHAPDPVALLALIVEGDRGQPAGEIPTGHARLGFVAADESEYETRRAAAMTGLRNRGGDGEWARDGVYYRRRAVEPDIRVAALFGGQGSQYPGMGQDAVLALPPVRATFDQANLLGPHHPPLADIAFPLPGTGRDEAAEQLRRTEYAQPAIGALAMGQYRYLAELGFAPDACLGHSFGELTALWAAGGLDDDGFLRLAVARGKAMAPPAERNGFDAGTMAAVRYTEDRLQAVLARHPDVTVCNRNAPDELVVGGPTAAVDAMVSDCRDHGIPAQPLSVAAAFHTRLVGHAVDVFAQAAAGVSFHAPVRPVLANTRDAAYGDDPRANRLTLVAQLTHPVEFQWRLEELYASGHRVFVEFGPRGILTGLVERTLGERDVVAFSTDVGPLRDGVAVLKEAAVRLAVLGLPLQDLNRYDPLPVEQVSPSRVARLLDGPRFALNEHQDTCWREALATPYQLVTTVAEEHTGAGAAAANGTPVPDQTAAELARIATEHLEVHSRYVDGQVRTAQQLMDLVREASSHGSAETVAREVEAIRDHGIALGRAHVRANEAFAELLRLSGHPGAPNGSVATPTARHHTETPRTGAPAPAHSATAGQAASAAEGMDLAGLEQGIRQLIADKTGYPVEMVGLDMDVQAHLGVDSLKLVEIAAELWRRYPDIPREALFRLTEGRTVSDFAAHVRRVLAEAGSGPVAQPVRSVRIGRSYVALRTLPEVEHLLGAYRPQPSALVVDDGGAVARALIGALRQAGWRTQVITLCGAAVDRAAKSHVLADWEEPTLAAALADLAPEDDGLDLCVVAMTEPRPVDGMIRALTHALLTAKHVRPALVAASTETTRASFVTVTTLDGALGYAGSHGRAGLALAGGLGGLVRTVALEAPEVFCRSLDFAPDLAIDQMSEQFLRELTDAAADLREVGYDGTVRRAPTLTGTPAMLLSHHEEADVAQVGQDDLFVVTGGARGVTSWCVTAMAEKYRCGFLLMGRTPLADRPDTSPEQEEIHATLAVLRALGVQAEYLAADVTDADAVRAVLAPYADQVTGFIHGAGVLADQWLEDKTADIVARVLGPKLAGLAAVLDAIPQAPLRHLVVFTSIAGLGGNLRQSDYTMANEALNRFACAWKKSHPACRVSAIAWGPWDGGMVGPAMRAVLTEHGIPLLTRDDGPALFVEQLAPSHHNHLVTVLGPTRLLYDRPESLPPSGVTVERHLDALASHPVVRDHAVEEQPPILPMSGAVGWCVHTLEGLHGGQPVVEARDVKIARGVVFDGSERDRFLFQAVPSPADGPGWVDVSIRSEDGTGTATLRYQGRFRLAAEPPTAPHLDGLNGLGQYKLPPSQPRALYGDGFFFHGSTLQGLEAVLAAGNDRVVAAARLAEPPFDGFTGRLYHGATADLLLQGAALLGRRLTGLRSLPLSVQAIELYAPLVDNEPFLVVAELQEQRAIDILYTVSACTPDGLVLQRWRGLSLVTLTPEAMAGNRWMPTQAPAQALSGTGG